MELPRPPIFRRKKFMHKQLNAEQFVNSSPFHAVPPFFDFNHSTTTWLINTIEMQNEKEIARVLLDKESNRLLGFKPDQEAVQMDTTLIPDDNVPELVISKAKYFQILDRPNLYDKKDTRSSLFNRHAVMYLTPLGLAIYLKKLKIVRLLAEYYDRDTNCKHMLARQPQFITYMNDQKGDLMCIYDHNLAMLCEAYDILALMLREKNWFPMEPFQLVYRKLYVETYLKFDDFMDYGFYIIFTKRSSFDIASLCFSLLKLPSSNFKLNYLSQPRRASRYTLLRDPNTIINNCKSYPRRLLRCAYYADKKMKSTLNLLRAAEFFIRTGMFKLIGGAALSFFNKNPGKRRLNCMPSYAEKSRQMDTEWPQAMYEFDGDCCISLLLAIIGKTHRLNKKSTFQAALKLIVLLLGETGWINYFHRICDWELRDYFMGLDDAEKVVFPETACSFAREAARITVIDQKYDVSRFFSEELLEKVKTKDLNDPQVLSDMIICHDNYANNYINLKVGQDLFEQATVIGPGRKRGKGRNDPKNEYYMNRLSFPPPSVASLMINAANDDQFNQTITTSEISANEVGTIDGLSAGRQVEDEFENDSVFHLSVGEPQES